VSGLRVFAWAVSGTVYHETDQGIGEMEGAVALCGANLFAERWWDAAALDENWRRGVIPPRRDCCRRCGAIRRKRDESATVRLVEDD